MEYTLKKALGQHFLTDASVCSRILEAVKEEHPKRLLEVGPGGGALTGSLLSLHDIYFKAIEVDQEKVTYLLDRYPAIRGKLIHQSILEADLPFSDPFVLVGNFPYNISSQIVFRILEWKDVVTNVIGMFQKEVALRIVAKEGSRVYGILSVLVQAFYETSYLFDVDEQSFNPPPKVKSGVIRLRRRKEVPEMKSKDLFFLLVKTAFNQRRKMLRNAVRSLFDEPYLQEDLFTKRAEQLSVEQFAALTFKMRDSVHD